MIILIANVNNKPKIDKGLRGIFVTETDLSDVNGTEGILTLRGYKIEEIAFKATFEEIINVMFYNRRENVQDVTDALVKYRNLPEFTVEALRYAVKNDLQASESLQLALSTIFPSFIAEKKYKKELIIASIPSIIAYYWRLKNNNTIIKPKDNLGHVANFLYMLEGKEASTDRVQALQTYLITIMDHGMNASTFASRVIISSESDLLSSVLGALGSLKGPKHGGAPGPVLDMVMKIAKTNDPDEYIRNVLENGGILYGFGHRIYKTRDPRADVMKKAGEKFYQNNEKEISDLFLRTEQAALKGLEKYKPGRKLYTNVEFYTAYLLHGIGINQDLITPLFASARAVGWLAHAEEQLEESNIIRPESYYTGPYNLTW